MPWNQLTKDEQAEARDLRTHLSLSHVRIPVTGCQQPRRRPPMGRWQPLPGGALPVHRLSLRCPVMFSAVLQWGRWPPGPA